MSEHLPTSAAEIWNLPRVCASFPELSGTQITRENLLSQIESSFQQGPKLIVFEGEEGVGKTTLLSQFAESQPNHAISLFIKTTNRLAYEPDTIRDDFCEQLLWILGDNAPSRPEFFDAPFLQILLRAFRRKARNTIYYIAVDGLDKIPDSEADLAKQISEMLPWGEDRIRLLLSGEVNRLFIPAGNIPKVFQVAYFSLEETIHFFENIVDETAATQIFRSFKGVPGRLAAIRRLLLDSEDRIALLNSLPQSHPQLFALEWNRANLHDNDTVKMLAILAHDRRIHTQRNLSRIAEVSIEDVQDKLKPLRFLELKHVENRDSSTGTVVNEVIEWVSESFREFAISKLHAWKPKVEEWRIEELLRNVESVSTNEVLADALIELTSFLENKNKDDLLLRYLTPDNLSRMLDSCGSLALVQRRANAGIEAAVRSGKDAQLTRLAIQQATLQSLEGAQVWRSEIEAHIALGDYEAAQALAETTIIKSERLHQLAVVANARHQKGLPVEVELDGEIRRLYDQIDPLELEDEAVEIATALLSTHPELSVQLVERANQTSGENALDWAFARLSIAAINQDQYRNSTTGESSISLKDRITSVTTQEFSSVASLLYGYGKYSGEEIVREARKLSTAGGQLFVLRQWAMGNGERSDADIVLEYALDVLVGTTQYIPSGRDLRQLAVPLPFLPNSERIRHLVSRFYGIRGTLAHRSATDDDVALRCLLARAEARFDFEVASKTIAEIYLDLCEVDDLIAKTTGLARLMSVLYDIDTLGLIEKKDHVSSLAQEDIEVALENLLTASADHYEATKDTIRNLARTHHKLALHWIEKLNMAERRNQALSDFITGATRLNPVTLDIVIIQNAFDRFTDSKLHDKALLNLLRRLLAHVKSQPSPYSESEKNNFRRLIPLLQRAKNIEDEEDRCLGYCLSLDILALHTKRYEDQSFVGLKKDWFEQLRATWNSLDAAWDKVNIGFKIVAYLSENYIEERHGFMVITKQLRSETIVDNATTAQSVLCCLYLASRAWSGLLPRGADMASDFDSMTRLTKQLPSLEDQVSVWTDMAVRAHFREKSERCREIVEGRIRPLLTRVRDLSPTLLNRVIVNSAPALYLAHEPTALIDIERLPEPYRDEACVAVCRVLLHQVAPTDPCSPQQGQGIPVSYPKAVDVCNLLKKANQDTSIAQWISALCDCIKASNWTQEQTTDTITTLHEIVKRLPLPGGIQHNGFNIVCRAHIARLERQNSRWSALCDEARQIPNSADVVFVLCIIAGVMPAAMRDAREALLEEARTLIVTLPVFKDRQDRYVMLIETAELVSATLSKRYIEEAMKSVWKLAQDDERFGLESLQSSQAYGAAQRLLDQAHRIDTSYATHIASLGDNEPVRQSLKDSLKERVEYLDLKHRLANEKQDSKDLREANIDEIAQMSWTLLGQMTARRMPAWRRDVMRDILRVAARGPVFRSYPLLAWTIENSVQRHTMTPQAGQLIRPFFESAILGGELSLKIAKRSSSQLDRVRDEATRMQSDSLIDAGQRKMALEIIEKWIQNGVNEWIKICDPFLDEDDVCKILFLISKYHPDCRVEILVSRKWLQQRGTLTPWRDTFKNAWRRQYDYSPPDTEITVIGLGDGGDSPIHDRWWLSQSSGLQTGTSYNGLGKKGHSIDHLSAESTRERTLKLNHYFERRHRDSMGERISYEMFNLD